MLKEVTIVSAETNIELFSTLTGFIEKMEVHMEKWPNYSYTIETLGGEPGSYEARVTIIRYDNKEAELAKGDFGSHGVL
jgi:hypothetical protein